MSQVLENQKQNPIREQELIQGSDKGYLVQSENNNYSLKGPFITSTQPIQPKVDIDDNLINTQNTISNNVVRYEEPIQFINTNLQQNIAKDINLPKREYGGIVRNDVGIISSVDKLEQVGRPIYRTDNQQAQPMELLNVNETEISPLRVSGVGQQLNIEEPGYINSQVFRKPIIDTQKNGYTQSYDADQNIFRTQVSRLNEPYRDYNYNDVRYIRTIDNPNESIRISNIPRNEVIGSQSFSITPTSQNILFTNQVYTPRNKNPFNHDFNVPYDRLYDDRMYNKPIQTSTYVDNVYSRPLQKSYTYVDNGYSRTNLLQYDNISRPMQTQYDISSKPVQTPYNNVKTLDRQYETINRPIQDQYQTVSRPIQDQYQTVSRPIQDQTVNRSLEQYETINRPIKQQTIRLEENYEPNIPKRSLTYIPQRRFESTIVPPIQKYEEQIISRVIPVRPVPLDKFDKTLLNVDKFIPISSLSERVGQQPSFHYGIEGCKVCGGYGFVKNKKNFDKMDPCLLCVKETGYCHRCKNTGYVNNNSKNKCICKTVR